MRDFLLNIPFTRSADTKGTPKDIMYLAILGGRGRNPLATKVEYRDSFTSLRLSCHEHESIS